MDGNLLYARNEDHRVHIASVAKIHIAMLFLASIETRAGNLSEYLASRALAGRSYEQLLYAMLVNSEKEATDLLFAAIKSNGLDMDSKMLAWGLMQTSVPYRKSTPYDMALTLEGLYKHQFISEQGSQYILDLMGVYTENDDTRIGVLKEYLSDAKIYNKRGTITDEFLVIADAGIVETGGKVYIIVMLGGQDENLSVNDAELTRTLEALIRGLGQFLR